MILKVKLATEGWRDSFDAVHIRLVFADTVVVPAARSCSVSFTDSEGITHIVEITASTLYEAAVLALAEFRRCGFAEATFGHGTKLTVRVRQPGDVSVRKRGSASIMARRRWEKSERARDEESVESGAINRARSMNLLGNLRCDALLVFL